MLEQLLPKLLEQSALIIVLIVGSGLLWKDRNRIIQSGEKKERAAKKEVKELTANHSKELRDLNQLVRDHEREHLTALDALTDALENFK
jgi:hypothetical protein